MTAKGDCSHEKDVAKCLAKGEGVSDKGLKSRVLKQGRVLKHHYDPLDIPLHASFFFFAFDYRCMQSRLMRQYNGK